MGKSSVNGGVSSKSRLNEGNTPGFTSIAVVEVYGRIKWTRL